MNDMTQAKYILGHLQQEIGRLILQATILRPFTERLMRNAEIGPGMRVLDVGCGAGDVSMLAAELVGPSGSVVGIDGNPQVVDLASRRVRTAGYDRSLSNTSQRHLRSKHRRAGHPRSAPGGYQFRTTSLSIAPFFRFRTERH